MPRSHLILVVSATSTCCAHPLVLAVGLELTLCSQELGHPASSAGHRLSRQAATDRRDALAAPGKTYGHGDHVACAAVDRAGAYVLVPSQPSGPKALRLPLLRPSLFPALRGALNSLVAGMRCACAARRSALRAGCHCAPPAFLCAPFELSGWQTRGPARAGAQVLA